MPFDGKRLDRDSLDKLIKEIIREKVLPPQKKKPKSPTLASTTLLSKRLPFALPRHQP